MTAPIAPRSEAPPPIGLVQRPEDVVPEPPTALCAAERRWWVTLWRTPVAAFWTVSDEPLIALLAKLYASTDDEPSVGVVQQINSISSRMGLNAESRQRMRVSTESRPTTTSATGRDRFRVV